MRSIAKTLSKYCDYTVQAIDLNNALYSGLPPGEIVSLIKDEQSKFQLSSGDSFLIYFAGHGGFDSNSKTSYLLMPESTPRNLQHTAVSLTDLSTTLSADGVHHFRLIDACHSGQPSHMRGRGSNDIANSLVQTPRDGRFGWIALASCAPNESCKESGSLSLDDDVGHGYFTYFLSNAIREKQVGEDIYLQELHKQTCEAVESNSLFLKQTPTMSAYCVGKVPFATRVARNVVVEYIIKPGENLEVVPRKTLQDINSSATLWVSVEFEDDAIWRFRISPRAIPENNPRRDVGRIKYAPGRVKKYLWSDGVDVQISTEQNTATIGFADSRGNRAIVVIRVKWSQ